MAVIIGDSVNEDAAGRSLPRLDVAGGASHFYGAPNNVTVIDRFMSDITLSQNTQYFYALYNDRERTLDGGFVSITSAGSASSILRAGLFELGEPNGSNWRPGKCLIDFGTKSADSTGDLEFTGELTLQKGWYLFGIGTDGTGCGVDYAVWMTPGQDSLHPRTGGSVGIRTNGVSTYLSDGGASSEISGGYDTANIWPRNVTDRDSDSCAAWAFFIPKWSV